MDSTDHDELEKKLEDPTAPPIFLPLQFLKQITCNFSTEQELGRGGYGAVYKGVLRSQKIIAVKKLFEIHLMEDNQFQNEVSYLMGIRHENVVRLVGYCAESRWEATMLPSGQYVLAQIPTRLLCFEYMCNGGLDKHATDESSGLDWSKRYDIIKGICSGLHFLHGDCHIVHLDLKPENILMDATMVPKIADFGLSRLLGAQKSRTIISGNFAGSLGYMAPEYLLKGVVSPKADIFSLGVIIIEIITGRRDYPHNTAAYYEDLDNNDRHPSIDISFQKFIDKVIGRWRNIFQTESKYTTPKIYTQQVQQCISIALQCVDHDLRKRPNARDICESFRPVESTNSQTGDSKDSMGREVSLANKSRELLSVQPLQLRFHRKPELVLSFCTLHLTNNSDNPVAFRIETQLGSDGKHGLVQSRTTCSCPIKVSEPDDLPILLESTIADQNLLDIKEPDYNQYNRFFIEAKDMGREVQQVKLSSAVVEIIQKEFPHFNLVCDVMNVHPTEAWIVMHHGDGSVELWDWRIQRTVNNSFGTLISGDTGSVIASVFIAQKQWVLTGHNTGCIRVCSYKTMTHVKTFDAHKSSVTCLDIHSTEPFVMSASPYDKLIKMWNWEKGWECVRTFGAQYNIRQLKFNPIDADYFGFFWDDGDVQIWSIGSSSCEFELTGNKSRVDCFDYFKGGDQLYMVTGHRNGSISIWDWKSRVKTLEINEYKRRVRSVSAHPHLPILITGSDDGTVRWWEWNSMGLRLDGGLNCGLGYVDAIVYLNESRRVAIGHLNGIAVTEI